MSLQMRVVHFCMGLVPPLLQSGTATEQMALHAPQPAPMPARMRGRFTATCDKGITRVFPKQGLRSGGALIFLHGGSYLFPLVDGQWGIVEGLIDRTGLPVIIPDYPLAPNHTAAEAFDFVQPIIDEAQAEFGRVILFGDSAGGGLALSLAMQRRDTGARQVDGLVLYAPWVDVTMTNPRIEEVQGRDKILRVPGLVWAGRAWAADLDPTDPRVSPLYGDPAGLPPMRIFQGDADILGPDTIEFARKAARAGVDVRLRVEPDGFHVYVLSVPIIPEAEAALDRSARFISGILTQA
ncbi:alpha/beta hydrolase [Actinomyces bouchesdurhonensis]|uniref:alpha/beta hydrolase n=1 Tax=Actinomyces bouchesdurhonensis TaxID=1852361 RepID=UPI00093EADB7|nr:alpha/beta hydrolase [Actinomyces bouchesdurhonensis]